MATRPVFSMYLCIYSEDTYPYEVIRHHDHCPIPQSDMTMEIEKDVDNFTTTWPCDMGDGEGIFELEVQDCECEMLELVSPLDTRNPDEIPF